MLSIQMPRTRSDEKVLSYKDVVLRESDLTILSGPHFLNDRIIDFYFSHLTSAYPSNDLLLLSPSIVFWIKECPDASYLKDFLQPLQFSSRKLILFPINDNEDVNLAEGGSHWSLLAFYRDANVFVHHDSLRGMNTKDAKRVYQAIIAYMESDAKYISCPTMPTQANGYDCGLYVTATAHAICEWYMNQEPKDLKELWFSDIQKGITSSNVSKLRNDILALVRSLMSKEQDI